MLTLITDTGLNEVQFPKELQRRSVFGSSRTRTGLNEVQFPKELQRRGCSRVSGCCSCLNEVQFPKELQHVTRIVTSQGGKPQ